MPPPTAEPHPPGSSRHTRQLGLSAALLVAFVPRVHSISSADCWVGGWTPEICCSAPGAKGNPLCWDHVYTFDKCCTETEEGIQFDLRRRNFVADMVRRGATVHFDIRHVSGGRTGAVASRAMSARATVLRVPATQVYSLKSVPAEMNAAARRHDCDAHAVLALGLALERVNPKSTLTEWIRLLPLTFANVLWFSERQLALVNATFFAYIVDNWFGDLDCMKRAADEIPTSVWRGRKVGFEDLRWALSVVKTRGFAFEGTRESTMLIPLADFLNHNMVASVRTATLAEDALRFVATRNIMPGEELCIDYAQASNLEFLVRYGFRVEDNPYGGRQFDLGGEPLQAHCPMYILRYDTADIIENTTVDCHRQARYLSFEQQFGPIQLHEQLREDRYIYRAVEEACQQLYSMLEAPRQLSEFENFDGDTITSVLVREIRTERVLLQRCVQEFRRRQLEPEPRPVPPTLAEPLARLRGQVVGDDEEPPQPAPVIAGGEDAGRSRSVFGEPNAYGGAGYGAAYGTGSAGAYSAAPTNAAAYGAAPQYGTGGATAFGGGAGYSAAAYSGTPPSYGAGASLYSSQYGSSPGYAGYGAEPSGFGEPMYARAQGSYGSHGRFGEAAATGAAQSPNRGILPQSAEVLGSSAGGLARTNAMGIAASFGVAPGDAFGDPPSTGRAPTDAGGGVGVGLGLGGLGTLGAERADAYARAAAAQNAARSMAPPGQVGGGEAPSFSSMVDRTQVDQLLQRLQQGASLA